MAKKRTKKVKEEELQKLPPVRVAIAGEGVPANLAEWGITWEPEEEIRKRLPLLCKIPRRMGYYEAWFRTRKQAQEIAALLWKYRYEAAIITAQMPLAYRLIRMLHKRGFLVLLPVFASGFQLVDLIPAYREDVEKWELIRRQLLGKS